MIFLHAEFANIYQVLHAGPIAVADTVGKIFCMVLNGRLKVNIERNGVYGENQNGFRALRRGEDNMYVISEMIERVKKEGKRVYMAFLEAIL